MDEMAEKELNQDTQSATKEIKSSIESVLKDTSPKHECKKRTRESFIE